MRPQLLLGRVRETGSVRQQYTSPGGLSAEKMVDPLLDDSSVVSKN